MKFAITIPTYQRPDGKTPFYLKRSLDSIFSQMYELFKIYLIGDKYENKRELFDIVNSYSKEKMYCENLPYAKERDKYLKNKKALWCAGGVNAINYAIDLALKDGFKYICHLDHDDYWKPNHLKILNEVIKETNADWVCTKSTHFNLSILPRIETDKKYIEFLPEPGGLINSSTCINLITIPIIPRDVFEAEGKLYPADADRWRRISRFISKNNLKSYLINNVTCVHDTESYIRKTQ